MKRVAKIAAGAVLFGTVAGASMVGVNVAANSLGIIGNSGTESVYESTTDSAFLPGGGETEAETEQTKPAETQMSGSSSNIAPATNTVRDVARDAMPSVVAITNMVKYRQNGFSIFGSYESRETEVPASGSGVIIGKTEDELLIVTNNHVVTDSSSLSVSFIDGKSVDAAIKGTDAAADLAVVAVKLTDIDADTLDAIEVISIGDSDLVEVGDQVVAIGNALGYGQSVTTGIISAKDRDVRTEEGTETGLLQTDAAINPGNSGGALLNMQGELIGINVAKYASTEVEGIGYSIPSSKAKDIIANLSSLTTREQVPENERGYLGVQVKSIDSATSQSFDMPQGVFIYKFTEGSSAQNSGLQEKDIITKLDGQGITDYDDLQSLLSKYRAGETVTVTVQRQDGNGKYVEVDVEVTLGSAGGNTSGSNSGSSSGSDQQSGSQDPFQRRDDSQENQGQQNPEYGNSNGSNGSAEDEFIEKFRQFFDQYQR